MDFAVSDWELRRMLDLVQPTFDRAPADQSFDHGLLSRLAAAFDCVDVTFQVSDPEREVLHGIVEGHQDGVVTVEGGFRDEDTEKAYWSGHWADDSCCYPEVSGDHTSVTTTTDFYSDLEYRARGLGAAYHWMECLMVPLPWDGTRDRRLLFWRVEGARFTERDRLVLTLLRPHFTSVLEAHDRAGLDPPVLTPRERELVTLLAGGLTNRQIGRELGIAEGTVRKHLEHVYARLGVTNRVAALAAYPDLTCGPAATFVLPELARAG